MTLGVLGTMVWDRIDHPDGETVERWGGITYSLAAAVAAVPARWVVRPIIKLGSDLARRGRSFLASLPGLDASAIVEVAEPNNRVHLRYWDRHHREEQLSGGVPGWSWWELEPHLDGLDGLYVNMISGFEMDSSVATTLGDRFGGPRYVDLHSLVLDVAEDGRRVPRSLEQRDVWLGAFDVIQVNQHELDLVAGDDDPRDVATSAVRNGAHAVLVTRGPLGADWFARSADVVWPLSDAGNGPIRSGTVDLAEPWTAGDPTGCGDVWGATCFARLRAGARLDAAMDAANRAAARNVDHRGADGLYEHLKADP
jgi:hypothetical protein